MVLPEFKPNLLDTATRMARFWNLEVPDDRVPVIVRVPNPGINLDGTWYGRLDAYRRMMEEYFALRAHIQDEYIPHVVPQYGHAAIAAICGSPILNTHETLWTTPVIDSAERYNELRLDWGNPVARQFMEDYDCLLHHARGRYAVAQCEIEGVSDTVSALRGFEGLLYELYEKPEAAHALLARVTDILIEFSQWNNKFVGERQDDLCGGMAFGYNLWMPKGSCTTCEDASVMVSDDYFREHFQAHVNRFTSSCTKALMEVHDEGFHQIGVFGKTPGVSLMTVRNIFGMARAHREALQNVLGKTCFMINVKNPDDIEELLMFTGLRGILLSVGVSDAADAERVLQIAERATQKVINTPDRGTP